MDILEKRLIECKINKGDIIESISCLNKEQTAIIYTSHLERLGTKNSDFDIYVLGDSIPSLVGGRKYEKFHVQTHVVKDNLLDIEYWKINTVYGLIEKINSESLEQLNLEELKLLHRLKVGEVIQNNEAGLKLKKLIEESCLNKNVIKFYTINANSYLEDAINMYNADEYICALNCARSALENAIGAYNAKRKITNLNLKWVSKIFLQENDMNSQIVTKYLKYQVFTNINESNLKAFVEDMIEFIQNILARITVSEL